MMEKKQWSADKGRFGVFAMAAVFLLPVFAGAQTLVLSNGYHSAVSLASTTVTMTGRSELHITGSGTPVSGCTINLNSIDSWVFLHQVKPSSTASLLSQFKVNGANAVNNSNVKLVQYGQGTAVVPYPSNFQPMEVFDGENFSGDSMSLGPYTQYGSVLGGKVSSFTLKRGYTATISQNANGTGLSINYVASDGDLRIGALPAALNNQVRFIRIFPWRWVGKKGSCDIAPANLNAQWYYNWNISSQPANPDYEYVAIKQQPYWPGLGQDWAYLGVNHLLGFNEPNNSVEDAYKNLTPPGDVNNAVARQPELLGTGLRLGAPAVTDGGRQWILDFVSGAEAAGYRLDYIPIHYYRASNNTAGDAEAKLYSFLKDIYDQTHKPIWLTEFNNGANWTAGTDPTFAQNNACIEAMINMMDAAPWVERYSIYSAVEEVRQIYYNAGGYTPMGQMYKDHVSPLGYQQIIPGAGMDPSATYAFESNLDDGSGSGNHALSKSYPGFVAGRNAGTTALALDGVDDHVILPDSLSDGTDFTFAAWVYWNGGSAWQRIFDFGIVDSSKYMFLTPNADGAGLRFAITTGGWGGEQRLTSASALPQNTWTHVAVTLGGSTGRLYVNGSQVATGTIALNPADLGAIQHYLGKSMFPADPYFSGKIDDVIIKNQALSAAQIAALMNNQPPQPSASLVDGGMAAADVPYSGSVAGAASDPDGGAVVYSKVYGPSWLSIASSGSLSGTPTGMLPGDQIFTVRATDTAGASTFFILNIGQVPDDFTTGPVASWDFNDPALGAANGAALPDSDGYTVWRAAAADKSGNGNHLTTWEHAWAGFNWASGSPDGNYSIVAAGSYPAAYTWSARSQPSGKNVETVELTNFTVEARFTVSGSGIRTVLGRDAIGVSTTWPNNAALYLGVDGSHRPFIEFSDINGKSVNLVASSTTLANNNTTWYHLAGVYDGAKLSLYLNGVLIASNTIAMDALAMGAANGSDWHAGGWSVGRGLRSGGHTDRWYGHIDAVAISGVALWPGAFVITGTWPEGYGFYFNDYGIPGAPFDGDANSNGVPNGMEYYLGWDPTNPVTTNPVLAFADDYWSVVHPFNPTASGVTGTVEWTTDLLSSNWYSTGVTYFTNTEPDEIEASLDAATTNDALFIRLKVDN